MGGVTPKTVGGGVRLRGVLFERGDDRILLGSPILYYPATKGLGNEPWLLAMPQLLAERAFDGGSRLHFGAGLALAACTDAIGAALSGTLSHAHAGGGCLADRDGGRNDAPGPGDRLCRCFVGVPRPATGRP